jgi:hypothetical protein
MFQSLGGPKNQKTIKKTIVSEPEDPQNQKTLRKTNVSEPPGPQTPKNIKENQCFIASGAPKTKKH